MSSSCRVITDDVAKCIRASPCMTEQGRDFHDCLKVRITFSPPNLLHELIRWFPVRQAKEEDITVECVRMRLLYFECKRAQLDMRKRFRGNPAHID